MSGPYIIRAAHRSEIPAAIRLWSEVFEVEEPYFQSLMDAEPHLPARATQVAINSQGEFVSSVQVFQRDVRMLDGRWLMVGGIGSVCTREDARQQGLSGGLLLESDQVMRFLACAWSLLFTGVHSHYARYGWQRVRMPYRYGPLAPASGPPKHLRIEEVSDFVGSIPALSAIHRQTLKERPLGSRRTRRAWHTAMTYRMRAPRNAVLLTWAGSEPLAYAHVRFEDGSACLCEAGCMKDSAEPLEELGAAVNALIRARGCDEVEVRLPRTRRWDPLIDRVVSRPEVGYDDSAMAKALDRRVGEAEIAELFEHPASQHFTADDF